VPIHNTTLPQAIERTTPFESLPCYLTVAELQSYFRISRSRAYIYAREHGIRIGRVVRVPRESLRNCA
jgi:hypothetical protein